MRLTIPALKILQWYADHPGGEEPTAELMPPGDIRIAWSNLIDLDLAKDDGSYDGMSAGYLTDRGWAAVERIRPHVRALLLRADLLDWLARTPETAAHLTKFYVERGTDSSEMGPIIKALHDEGKIKALGTLGGYTRVVLHSPGHTEAMSGEVEVPFQLGRGGGGSSTTMSNYGTMNVAGSNFGGHNNVAHGTMTVGAGDELLSALGRLRDAIVNEPSVDDSTRSELLESVDGLAEESANIGDASFKRHLRTLTLAAAGALGSQAGQQAVEGVRAVMESWT